MQLDDIKSVLTFAAFRPDPDDVDLPWSTRFAGRRSLLMNISRGQVTWRAVDRKGRLQEVASQEGEFAEVASQRADEWRGLTEGGWCSISINQRFIISLESNLSRRENFSDMLRTSPKTVLGAKYDRGKRYAAYHQPEATASILLACEDAMVRSVEDILRANKLKPGRISCALFAMLEAKLREVFEQRLADPRGTFLIVALVEGSVAALVEQDGVWTDLRCRSGVTTDGPEQVAQIVGPLISKMPPGAPLFIAHDGMDPRLATGVMEQIARPEARDVSGLDLMWNIIGQC